jgi:hypothetical protein
MAYFSFFPKNVRTSIAKNRPFFDGSLPMNVGHKTATNGCVAGFRLHPLNWVSCGKCNIT